MFTLEHDRTIGFIISNLVMCRVLLPPKVARHMAHIGTLTDDELTRQLVGSKRLLDGYYRQYAKAIRN